MPENTRSHWDEIYESKEPHELSWTEDVPAVSLSFFHQLQIPKNARIIDIGGGDSKLVDYLLREGYTDLSVLDISATAINKAKARLGADEIKVKWIVADILHFKPDRKYDVWHDRAAFHFQTEPEQIQTYLGIVKRSVDGIVIVGTFSKEGPDKCSGLPVQQYDEHSMKETFEHSHFRNVECKLEDHHTPAGQVQNYIFCSFIREA